MNIGELMKRIQLKLGELFEIDNGRYISTWKFTLSNGIKLERQLNIDWQNLEDKIDAKLKEIN